MNTQSSSVLKNKVAVVTGGGRGIGAAIARRLAQLGAAVVVSGRSLQTLQQTATSIRSTGGIAEPIACDVSQWQSVRSLAEEAKRKFQHVDILVNNAGIGGFASPLHELEVNSWDEILNTNLRGVFYCIKAFAPLLIAAGRGDIVNISSNGAAYSASKWGLNGLSYSVAEELRKYKIRVSVVCPGSTNTDLSPHEGKDFSRMLQPEDVAECVALIVTQAERAFTSEILLRPTQKP